MSSIKTENNDVGKFLRLFTDLNLKEITEIEKFKDEEVEKGKEILATKITELVHGKDSDWLSKKSVLFSKKDFKDGFGLLKLMSNKDVNLSNSNSEARRLIKSKAVKINKKLITDEKYSIKLDDFLSEGELMLSVGKKKNIIIKLN